MSQHVITMEALVNATRVVELRSTTRDESIAELVAASGCTDWGISAEKLIAAVQEREDTAQTVVADDLAIPHASVDWDGDFTVVLGRSRRGVQFGAGDTRVQLVVLLITGKRQSARHVQVLAALAELIKETDFRRTLIEASGAKTVLRLLQERAGIVTSVSTVKPQLSVRSLRLTEQAVQLAMALEVQAILMAVDRLSNVPWNTLTEWPGRILIVATHVHDEERPDRKKTRVFEVPHAGLSRIDRANLGMLLAASSGLLADDSDVVCVTGPPGMSPDCIAIIRPADKFHSVFQGNIEKGTARIPPAVILRVISLAIEISSEGREGKAIGTMFVLGDKRQVQRRSRQLVLNPFHGYSRRIRNVLDPGLSETVKEYASLDGAFIIAADGTMLSAGTYLVPEKSSGDLPGGLGARHQTAASITAQTKAMAVVVSQSTGKVSIFQNGSSILSLERSSLTRW